MQRRTRTERIMAMSDEVWARHANPWSGWSRMAIVPLFALAVWSRDWIGGWSLIAIALVCSWIWLNPRAFRPPDHLENWMSQAVLGERIWLDRQKTPLPPHHRTVPLVLASVSGVGLLPLGWGLWQFDVWRTVLGVILIIGGKLWFLDRMVWLHVEHRDHSS